MPRLKRRQITSFIVFVDVFACYLRRNARVAGSTPNLRTVGKDRPVGIAVQVDQEPLKRAEDFGEESGLLVIAAASKHVCVQSASDQRNVRSD